MGVLMQLLLHLHSIFLLLHHLFLEAMPKERTQTLRLLHISRFHSSLSWLFLAHLLSQQSALLALTSGLNRRQSLPQFLRVGEVRVAPLFHGTLTIQHLLHHSFGSHFLLSLSHLPEKRPVNLLTLLLNYFLEVLRPL